MSYWGNFVEPRAVRPRLATGEPWRILEDPQVHAPAEAEFRYTNFSLFQTFFYIYDHPYFQV
jgi:hypothetical protein